MSTVVVGVGGGVAAFKVGYLVRALTKAGHHVRVIPTDASCEFVGVATWEALSGTPVHTGVFDAGGADHVEIARKADLIVIAPATADLMARLRAGMANDLLTTTVLASPAPVVLAPAMHTAMWENPATQDNVTTLRQRGMTIVGPEEGDLSSGDHGPGRMVEPQEIATRVLSMLNTPAPSQSDMTGLRVLITAGGTHEAVDPVRYLANYSTGAQGIALATEAYARGAKVTLIGANIDAERRRSLPDAVTYVAVASALEMHHAVHERLGDTDALIMAAAVADFRPDQVSAHKIKKTDDEAAPAIRLKRNPDILAEVAASPQRPRVVIGFAAETGTDDEILAYARAKAARKNADLLVLNRVGAGHGFGDVTTTITLLTSDGTIIDHAHGSKTDVARTLATHIVKLMHGDH